MTREERREYYRRLDRKKAQREREQWLRRYHRDYERRHYASITCRVPRETAAEFTKLCARYGKTPYRALKDAVLDALRRDAERLAGEAPDFR